MIFQNNDSGSRRGNTPAVQDNDQVTQVISVNQPNGKPTLLPASKPGQHPPVGIHVASNTGVFVKRLSKNARFVAPPDPLEKNGNASPAKNKNKETAPRAKNQNKEPAPRAKNGNKEPALPAKNENKEPVPRAKNENKEPVPRAKNENKEPAPQKGTKDKDPIMPKNKDKEPPSPKTPDKKRKDKDKEPPSPKTPDKKRKNKDKELPSPKTPDKKRRNKDKELPSPKTPDKKRKNKDKEPPSPKTSDKKKKNKGKEPPSPKTADKKKKSKDKGPPQPKLVKLPEPAQVPEIPANVKASLEDKAEQTQSSPPKVVQETQTSRLDLPQNPPQEPQSQQTLDRAAQTIILHEVPAHTPVTHIIYYRCACAGQDCVSRYPPVEEVPVIRAKSRNRGRVANVRYVQCSPAATLPLPIPGGCECRSFGSGSCRRTGYACISPQKDNAFRREQISCRHPELEDGIDEPRLVGYKSVTVTKECYLPST
ncbi:hypothetical protein ElyMa_002289200 [Elysia marginata]|uniref:Uncharacterized protein n=1 Tax=Elysia marginata TaxID=1093978 RepID=A0AAV4G3A7_9GAST|nr:hypothetical protein ElyMa_002289200 [Elysia marginata]